MSLHQIRIILLLIITVCVFCHPFSGKTFGEDPGSENPRQNIPRKLPGIQNNEQILLSNQWSVKPAGKQVVLGDFPVNIALHPKEHYAAILHAGYGEHEIVIVALDTSKIVSRVTIPQCFYGICFDTEGKRIFASGGEQEVIHQYKFSDGYLSEHQEHRVANASKKGVVAGISCSHDGNMLFAANAWDDNVAILPLDDANKIQFTNFENESYPYTTLPSLDGSKLYVSLWGKSAVAVINIKSNKAEDLWKTESHPTEMALSPEEDILYVACANSNAVMAIDTATGKVLETIETALYPKAPNGSTPNSLSLSPKGDKLLVANADNNNVSVINVSKRGESKSQGFIPTGWYPTSVRFDVSGDRIYVANGKGITPKTNIHGPNPLIRSPKTIQEYIASLYQGTLSIIKAPSPKEMAAYTRDSYACSPLCGDFKPITQIRESDNPIPSKIGESCPIKFCIYIVKENRTYDQVFGDMPEGNGDKDLCIFPEKVTPNHHALAREFVLLDNFYADAEVSADGHEWSMAAYATDFVEKSWPLNYRPSKEHTVGYPSEGDMEIAFPSSGYIWDRCKAAGLTYRSYGEFVHHDGIKVGGPGTTKVKTLEGHFDPFYRGWDLDYSDQKRVDRFIEELHLFETEDAMPQFIVLRLPNDHTAGLKADKLTPLAMLANNDLALGRFIEAVSHSKFWKEMAIFVVEDDAQNGSDHVDAHRTVALVISPYTKRHYVDSSFYSTSSMLRTMELILGIPPMTQFDAAALPMYASFQARPDLAPYKHLPPNIDLNEKNSSSGWGAKVSEKLDFSEADAVDDLLFE